MSNNELAPSAAGARKRTMHDDHIPTTDVIHGWIEEIFSWGVRRPGYEADRRAEEHAIEQFRAFGLERVRREPVELPFWEPLASSLSVHSAAASFDVPCFPLPHSAPTEPIELELTKLDADAPDSARGKAAFVVTPLMALPPTLAVDASGVPDDMEIAVDLRSGGIVLDPRKTFDGAIQTLPFSPAIQEVMEPSIAAGASAFIGMLEGYPGNSCQYYVPYDGISRPIPGVWIRSSDGSRIQALLAEGPVSIRLEVQSKRETITSHNIIGELPGADDECVIIGSHHDGPWASAVEDASGISLVLAQARYWSKVPAAERPHRLMFLLNAGHMAGGAGCHAFIRDHSDLLEQIVLEIHLEHAANEFRERDGKLEPTGEPEPRWFFTSQNPDLKRSVVDALQAEDIDRAFVIAPDTFGDQPTTDGGAFHPAGVPLVNYLTAPFYLFDAMDTLDKIHRESLVPITRATIRMIEATTGISAAHMVKGIHT
ncbi:MAG: M28 family peptidase [bacterium]|nr:M28 family peptidase [bacterium]